MCSRLYLSVVTVLILGINITPDEMAPQKQNTHLSDGGRCMARQRCAFGKAVRSARPV